MEDWEERLRAGMQENRFDSFDVAKLLETLEVLRREKRWFEQKLEEIRDAVGSREE